MASPTQWSWVWVNSGSGWWTGRPGVLRFMGSQRVGHDWATELNWTEGSLREILKYGSFEASSERHSIKVAGERGTLKQLSKWGPKKPHGPSCSVSVKQVTDSWLRAGSMLHLSSPMMPGPLFFLPWLCVWDLSSPAKYRTHSSCTGSPESQPLDGQGRSRDRALILVMFARWTQRFAHCCLFQKAFPGPSRSWSICDFFLTCKIALHRLVGLLLKVLSFMFVPT